ncbi:MAG TPA: caspase family protein [Thermoanaerobaculia bacterium]|nr:caspase family protein [Thermoanaerobaculia bacterium]
MPAEDAPEAAFRHHHALLIGISQYQHKGVIEDRFGRISQADGDARRLEALLLRLGYGREKVRCLTNQEATLEAIRAELRGLAEIPRAELVLVFWAGHGARDENLNHLLPYGADPHDPHLLAKSSFTVNEIADLASVFSSGNLALFFDTCFSAPNPGAYAWPAWSEVPKRLSDRVAIFAGASTYLALESPTRGGVLAQCLEQALADAPGTLHDEQGLVRVPALAAYLDRQVAAEAKSWWIAHGQRGSCPQEPCIASRPHCQTPLGRNLPFHIRARLAEATLPPAMRALAERVLESWPKPG